MVTERLSGFFRQASQWTLCLFSHVKVIEGEKGCAAIEKPYKQGSAPSVYWSETQHLKGELSDTTFFCNKQKTNKENKVGC